MIIKLYKNIYFRWLLLPFAIFVFSFLLLLIHLLRYDFSPTVLSYNHSKNIKNEDLKIINDGDSLTGSFTAKEDNLGIVSLYFETKNPIKGILNFELTEKDGNKFIISNSYDTREFFYLKEYPFGFPIIENSKNKEFVFKISFKSFDQSNDNFLTIKNSNLVSKYKFSSKNLLKSPTLFKDFIIKKLIYSFSLNDNFKYYLLYTTPFLAIIILNFIFEIKDIISLDKFFIRNKYLFKLFKFYKKNFDKNYILIYLLNVFSSVLIPISNSWLYLFFIIIWVIYIIKKKAGSKLTYLHILNLLILVPFFISFSEISEKLVSLIFIHLVIAFVQSTIEYNAKKRK